MISNGIGEFYEDRLYYLGLNGKKYLVAPIKETQIELDIDIRMMLYAEGKTVENVKIF